LKLEYQANRDNKNIEVKNEEEKIGKKIGKGAVSDRKPSTGCSDTPY
jgi:hypothetical protein